ncbi:MAG: cytochrome c biogenesis protein CcsA, partial [Candidatus Lambdaproteobacteria bacterium]|nr:cytochrome c biogenesis protein CcsA [Candidatus Lambdaproteobacteria bacterium]
TVRGGLGRGLLAVGWGAHTLILASQVFGAGSPTPPYLSVAAWLALVLFFVAQRRHKNTVFGFILPPFAIALLLLWEITVRRQMAAAPIDLVPLPYQALLITHITTVLAGHLLFALACLFGIAYLYSEHLLKTKMVQGVIGRFPSLSRLSRLNHKAIALGFFFLSVGIILGFLAAGEHAQPGQLFSMRQVIPVLTWLLYAAFLLEHSVQGRRGRFGAIWSIVGFIVVSTSLAFELSIVLSRA